MRTKYIIVIFLIIIFCIGAIFGVIVGHNKKNKENQEISNNQVIENSSSTNITVNNVNNIEEISMDIIYIKVNNQILEVKLEENSSVTAFLEKLKDGDIVVKAHDYGNFEKVGSLDFSLPTNDTRITTESGDLILYQGNQITLYYDTNTWSFTKLGKVQGISQEELKNILGGKDVTLTFTLIK